MGRIRVSTAGVAVAAFWAIAVLGAAFLPMTDPDTWWHIRVGREILETGAVPDVDRWSIAGAGRPWVSQDWTSNILMAALYAAGEWGPTLVSIVYGLMTLAAIGLLWDAISIRDRSIGWLARSAWLLIGLILAAPVLGARVQVVDLLLATASLNVLWRYIQVPRAWHLAALPLIAVAWVNLHAGFPLLFLLGGAVIVGELVDAWLRSAPGGIATRARALGALIGSLAVAAAALSLNPNGPAIYTYPFDTLGIDALASFVGEWQPASLATPAGQLLAAFVVVGVGPALLLGRDRLRTADGLMLLGLTFMAVTALRFVLVAGPIGATVACLAVGPALSASGIGRSAAGMLTRFGRVPAGGRGTVNAVLASLVLVAGIGIGLARVTPGAQHRAISEVLPVAAVDWLIEHDPGVRVFNRYEWGGYLGLIRPDRQIFIDGRADIYGDEIILPYVEVISVNQDPGAYLDRHAIDHVLYPADSTLGHWLEESPAWRAVYEDEVASVWVRD